MPETIVPNSNQVLILGSQSDKNQFAGFVNKLNRRRVVRDGYVYKNNAVTPDLYKYYGKKPNYSNLGAMMVLPDPIARGTKKILRSIVNKSKWLYNKGNIFNTSMKYNPDNFYREVSKEAIDDAIKSGVVRTGNSDNYIGPFFAKGDTPWHRKKYIIEGYPEKNDWIYANPYENAFWVGKEDSSTGKALMQQALNYKVSNNTSVGAEVFPYTNKSINATPTSNFSYWKKYPIIGWRKNSFLSNTYAE